MESKRTHVKKIRERVAKRKASFEKRERLRLFIENLSTEKFCEILDGLPSMFRIELTSTREDFAGYWEKRIIDGNTVWYKDGRFLPSSFFFPFREKFFDIIDKQKDTYYRFGGKWRAIRGIRISDV